MAFLILLMLGFTNKAGIHIYLIFLPNRLLTRNIYDAKSIADKYLKSACFCGEKIDTCH